MTKKIDALVFSMSMSLGLLAYYLLSPRFDSDILWSIAVGKWISLNGRFPVVDSFSWTINGQEWLTHEWLYCFMAYKINLWWGSAGLYILAAIPIGITIYVLYLMCKKIDKNNSYTFVLILAIGISLLYSQAIPFRAYIYALMLFVILIYLLYFKEYGSTDPIYYTLLFIFWANIQISVFIGLAILCFESLRQTITKKNHNWLLILPLCMLATLINPYGYKIWGYFLFMLTNMDGAKSIEEWRAADFNNLSTLFMYLGLAASIIALQIAYTKKYILQSFDIIKPHESDVVTGKVGENSLFSGYERFLGFIENNLTEVKCFSFLFLAFYIYSLYSVRMIYFSIILWVILMSYYAGRMGSLNFTKRTHYIFVFLAIAFFLGTLNLAKPDIKNIFDYDHNISPAEEVQFLKDNPIYQKHLFNEYLYGGYLIINNIPVFIDARSDSYIKFGVQKKYGDIIGLKQDPQIILDEMGVQNIIIPNDMPFGRYLSVNHNWSLVYKGPSASIYTQILPNR